MKNKLYFNDEEAEFCYSLEWHLDEAKEEGLSEIELFEAVPDKDDDYFWCGAASTPAMTRRLWKVLRRLRSPQWQMGNMQV